MAARKGSIVVLTKKAVDYLKRSGCPDVRIGSLARVNRTVSRLTHRDGVEVQMRDCELELLNSARPFYHQDVGWWMEEEHIRVVTKKRGLPRKPGANAVLRELNHIRDVLRFTEPELAYNRKLSAWAQAIKITLAIFTMQEEANMARIPVEDKVIINLLGSAALTKQGVPAVKPQMVGTVKQQLEGDHYEVEVPALVDGDNQPRRFVLTKSQLVHVIGKERLRGQPKDPMTILAEIVYCKEILKYTDPDAYKRRMRRAWKKARHYLNLVDRGEIIEN